MSSQVVLITGASSGFGRACAEHLAGLGHRVYGTSRRARFEDAPASGPVMIPMDVCDDDSVRKAVAFVAEREGRLDAVVNNAGVGLAGSVEDTSVAEARSLFETNFFGVHRVCRAVLPILRAQGRGRIVNVSSIGGLVTIPFQGFYSASKYAVESLSDALRVEVAPFGIDVVLIEPGDFRTDFTDARVFSEASRGESAYAERCGRAIAQMEHDERNGSDPLQLAKLLARVLETRSPRPRYVIGMPSQKAGAALKPFLPDRLFDRILGAIYKV